MLLADAVFPVGLEGGKEARLVLLLECFVPSANLIIVVSQQVGNRAGAETLAKAYVWQYLLGLLSLPVLMMGAIQVVFGDGEDSAVAAVAAAAAAAAAGDDGSAALNASNLVAARLR